jgi:hypothetical protein
METMEKRGPKTHKPIVLNIQSVDHDKVNESIEFKKFIYDGTVKAIQFAIKHNKKKCTPFKIGNPETDIEISKANFGPVLDKMIAFFETQENFKKCDQLVKLKGQI